MSKRVLILLLVGLNLFLAAGLIFSVHSPPTALAQEAGKRGGIALVAAQAELHNDAVYLLDSKNHRLHAFRSTFPRAAGGPTRVGLVASRDLRADLMLRAPGGAGGEEK